MAVPSRRQDQRALRVRDYLLLHLHELVTLDRTGEALGMSASTIQRALRDRWGIGFHEQLDRLRVERFLKMLTKDPDLKIEPFSPDVGWQSKANLYASVLRVTGYSLPALRADHALLTGALAALAADKSASVTIVSETA